MPADDYDPDRLTWPVLLARWTAFARASLALPTTGDAGHVRDSVPDIIALQAVWFALADLHTLAPDERALATDRAAVLIQRHRDAITRRFAGAPMPRDLQDLITDAQARLAETRPLSE